METVCLKGNKKAVDIPRASCSSEPAAFFPIENISIKHDIPFKLKWIPVLVLFVRQPRYCHSYLSNRVLHHVQISLRISTAKSSMDSQSAT